MLHPLLRQLAFGFEGKDGIIKRMTLSVTLQSVALQQEVCNLPLQALSCVVHHLY